MLSLAFTDDGWGDYQHGITTDRAILKRANILITFDNEQLVVWRCSYHY